MVVDTVVFLCAVGYTVDLEGPEIVFRWRGTGVPDAAVIGPLIEDLKRHRDEAVKWLKTQTMLPDSVTEWPQQLQECYEERAAIIEHHGGLPRREAENRAETLVRTAYWREIASASGDL